MSKTVFVTTEHGAHYEYDATHTDVQDGYLLVMKDDYGVAIHRDWLHAEVQDQPDGPAAQDSPDLSADAHFGETGPVHISVEAPVHDFRDALAPKPDCTRACCPSCCSKECK